MIGGGRENNNLYLLEFTRKEPKVLQSTITKEDEDLLWHHSLGHALV